MKIGTPDEKPKQSSLIIKNKEMLSFRKIKVLEILFNIILLTYENGESVMELRQFIKKFENYLLINYEYNDREMVL